MPRESERKVDSLSSPVEMTGEEFRAVGHTLVDRIAEYLDAVRSMPVTPGESPEEVRALLGDEKLPQQGAAPARLLKEAADLVINHSLLNGHPRFWGYVNPSSAPIGALGDLLAGAVNPNVGGWLLSPIASEIEAQTVRWIAEMLGFPTNCGGLLVSGGNMANFVGFLAARRAKAAWDVRAAGFAGKDAKRMRAYVSNETHTWIHKATDLFGLGTDSIRWIPVDDDLRMNTAALREQIRADEAGGDQPFLIVGTAGTVSTGAVDPLVEIAAIAREHNLWFHVDGAYGAFGALLPDASPDFKGLAEADSVAVDPHKWLFAPLEAGCTLVRDRQTLLEAFRYTPPYYHFDEEQEKVQNYFEYGPQNSRGFRALKVWLLLRQLGREGYRRLIGGDIALGAELFALADAHPELEACTRHLSITTFRYVPRDLVAGDPGVDRYLDELNTALLAKLKAGGQVYVSNATVEGRFMLRACIVNFRTTSADLTTAIEIIVTTGRELDAKLRPNDS